MPGPAHGFARFVCDQQPTGPPPAGQVGMVIGMQLTDVVETENARSSATKTLFPLLINWTAYARPGDFVTR
jgi:hypothetical protein